MTTSTITPGLSAPAETDHATVQRLVLPVAIGSAVVHAFFEIMRADSGSEAVGMTAFGVVVTALIYGLVVRGGLRHESAPVRALVLAVVGVLTIVAFWSGLSLILGAAAVLLGYAGKRASSRSGLCIAALVIGALSVIGYLAIFIGDWIAHPGASWFS